MYFGSGDLRFAVEFAVAVDCCEFRHGGWLGFWLSCCFGSSALCLAGLDGFGGFPLLLGL